ncbi:MAG TPA: hypothetical protein DD473_06730 [Planctomycetaceae bacterium]|nr:hypothetical protein [Planctomycetaceae bacterium]|tara:strand:+ start:858 stop:1715 length:858 start_codon:yes stop_codon:yes gene_type:complete
MQRNRYEVPIKLGKPSREKSAADRSSSKSSCPEIIDESYRLKAAYRFTYRYFETGQTGELSTYEPSGKYRDGKAWAEIIEKLHEQGIDDSVAYVRTLFHSKRQQMVFPDGLEGTPYEKVTPLGTVTMPGRRGFRPISPYQIAAPSTVGKFNEWLKNGAIEDLKSFHRERSYARTEVIVKYKFSSVSISEACRMVISDEWNSLSALFRYLLALDMIKEPSHSKSQKVQNRTFRTLCLRFEEKAYHQFLGIPSIHRKYIPVPAGFAERANIFYESLVFRTKSCSDRQ